MCPLFDVRAHADGQVRGGETLYVSNVTGTSYNDVTGGTWTWNYYRVTAVNAGGQESPPTADVGGYKTC